MSKKKKSAITKRQASALRMASCVILERYDQTTAPMLHELGVPKKYMDRMEKAMDIINSINEEMSKPEFKD